MAKILVPPAEGSQGEKPGGAGGLGLDTGPKGIVAGRLEARQMTLGQAGRQQGRQGMSWHLPACVAGRLQVGVGLFRHLLDHPAEDRGRLELEEFRNVEPGGPAEIVRQGDADRTSRGSSSASNTFSREVRRR